MMMMMMIITMEHTKPTLWAIVLCAGLLVWLYLDVKSMKINYDWHNYLINTTTGHKIKPNDMIDLAKIINNQEETYLNLTNSIERLYDLEYQTNLENPFALDQVYTYEQDLKQSGWPVSNQTSCARELDWIHSRFAVNKEYALTRGRLGYELTQLMDSFGKPESGLYSGVVTWLGSYKQCKRLTLNGGQIKTRYCLARMRPTWWPSQEAVNPKSRIKIGICLPETCDTNSFAGQKHKIGALIKLTLADKFLADHLEFESMFCLPDERSPLRQLPTGGRTYLLVVGSWLLLVLFASALYELVRRRERRLVKMAARDDKQRQLDELEGSGQKTIALNNAFRNLGLPGQISSSLQEPSETSQPGLNCATRAFTFKLLEALSVHNSLKSFKSNTFQEQRERILSLHQERQIRVNLSPLSSIKFLMAIAVVLAHSSYLTSIYARSLTYRVDLNLHGTGRMVLSVARCVDTFFVFFGLLTAYTLLRKFSINQLSSPLVWLGINLGILLRITPVFMLIYWFSRTISPYLGEGPWWDYGVFRYSMKGNCMHEPWWKSIPYFGCSGSPPVAGCVLPAWFLVSYSQLSLLMPLVTYLLYKLPGHFSKFSLLLFVSIISGFQLALKMYKQTSFKEEAFSSYGGFVADLLEKFESTGTMATLGRVGCVSIGCYVGYLLRMYEKEKILEWPSWLRAKTTILLVFFMHLFIVFVPLIGPLLTGQHKSTMDEFVTSYVTTMILWPMMNAILIINAVTTYQKTALVRFFSHPFWHSANKLGLSIYLVHWEIIFLGVTSFEQAPSMGFLTDVMKMWSFGVFFSILLAFLIHILVDAPISALLMAVAKRLQHKFMRSSSHGSQDDKLGQLTGCQDRYGQINRCD